MADRLKDKRCLIIGGTTGLGLAAARRFLEEGSKLVIAGRSVDKGAAAVDALNPLAPVHFFAGDVSDAIQVKLLFEHAAESPGKGGILAMSRLAAASYAAEGIRVNVIAPGLIDTPMAARAVQDPLIREFLRTKQPLRQGPGTAEDCADAAVFLCSDEARF